MVPPELRLIPLHDTLSIEEVGAPRFQPRRSSPEPFDPEMLRDGTFSCLSFEVTHLSLVPIFRELTVIHNETSQGHLQTRLWRFCGAWRATDRPKCYGPGTVGAVSQGHRLSVVGG
jgi:hypothetical protein